MGYQFKSTDGLCQSDNIDLITSWDNIVNKQKKNENDWISMLRSKGIKAAHPDDGWVDRNLNKAYLPYPQFNDGVREGDLIALGWSNKWRIVKITKVEETMFGMKYYWSRKE